MTQPRVALLDRDGTIIVERHYLSDPAQVELLPGAVDGLRALQAGGYALVMVTNQSAIGRGMFSETRLDEIHQHLCALLAENGVTLEKIYFCPHTPDDACGCRKPNIGLVERAIQDMGFRPCDAVVIGDKPCDIELGQRIGAATVLVRTGYGKNYPADHAVQPTLIAETLVEAAQLIQQGEPIR